jgi:hypothetical protein
MIKDYYFCETCGVISWEDVIFCTLDAYSGPDDFDALCKKCEQEVIEQYECPIHGVLAPDSAGGCAKC